MDQRTYLPIDCAEQIFLHLSGKDLLKCTLVCPGWNDFIGSTRSCMEKIYLTSLFILRDSEVHPQRILEKSEQKYVCFKNEKNDAEEIQKCLQLKKGEWTHISLCCNVNFDSAGDLLNLLRIFESSVEKLRLNYCYVPGFRFCNLQFK